MVLERYLANLYQCPNGTKDINKAVKRNINCFPEKFCFKLTNLECLNLRSQFATSSYEINKTIHGGVRYLPYVFTEHGVIMLSGLLKSDIASQVNIIVVKALVEMKRYLSNGLIQQKYINDMVIKHDNEIKLLQESFGKLEIKNDDLFFEGQIYDVYSLMINILNTSKTSITIIDNYLDKTLLDILSKTNKDILIITNQYNNNDYIKYQKQYSNVTLKINNKIHDRFIIIDNKTLYHYGASFKDLGNKCFAITKVMADKWLKEINKNILEKIK